ncbi:protein of unknown function [Cupriavidus taiwanensis]|uniref:Uncharacterized protein n=1 Tax=Cupriavidus taiwanensis TaxID=164546 RepID=A0A375IKX0_9BURK|nr:hypothetical protein CBM2592_A10030 [Cupriavidus taiwanensis]SPK74082.1 protein of unknown function [Cupriavidus taiwanensis]
MQPGFLHWALTVRAMPSALSGDTSAQPLTTHGSHFARRATPNPEIKIFYLAPDPCLSTMP